MPSEIILHPDWKEFFDLLQSRKVDFVIVGAWALAAHGKPRSTGDIDILIRPSLDSARRLIDVLSNFGFGSLEVTAEQLSIPDRRLVIGNPPFQIDIMTGISGVAFDQIWQNKVELALAGIRLPFIGINEYMQNKRAAGRPKDLADLHEMEQILKASP